MLREGCPIVQEISCRLGSVCEVMTQKKKKKGHTQDNKNVYGKQDAQETNAYYKEHNTWIIVRFGSPGFQALELQK